MRWETIEVQGRGWYVRAELPKDQPTAFKHRTIGPMGDMVAPYELLSPEEALAICNALNDLEPPEVLRRRLHRYVASLLRDDANGHSENFKEFWESCMDQNEIRIGEGLARDLADRLDAECER